MTQWVFDKEQQVGRLQIDGAVTVAQVGQLKAMLMEAVEQAQTVLVDLSRAEPVDMAGLQLFCAAHRFARACGKELRCCGGGERLRVLVCAAGFAHGTWCNAREQTPCLWAEVA
jgi:ABC-type transporter Mla MlaB component